MIEDFREKSFWLSQDPYEANPPLHGPMTVDVAIVGGGFAGLSTAYYLRQAAPSPRVAVLEAGVVGYGASGRNAGFAMTIFGLSLPMMVARFGRRRAMDAYRSWSARSITCRRSSPSTGSPATSKPMDSCASRPAGHSWPD